MTNIDTLSAYIDRLITERIKLFFFEKDGLDGSAHHQRIVIRQIRDRIAELLVECFQQAGYEYIGEKRTFDENAIVESIEQLVVNDILIGEGDRARLNEITSDTPDFQVILKNEKITRKSNEGRAREKNFIDNEFANLFDTWVKKQS